MEHRSESTVDNVDPVSEREKDFLKWVVTSYKKILTENASMLRISAVQRPPVINKLNVDRIDDSGDKVDIMKDWNTEYIHAQKVLDVCREQLRTLVYNQPQYIYAKTYYHNDTDLYNIDFVKFMNTTFEYSPASWFEKINDESSDTSPSEISEYETSGKKNQIGLYVSRIHYEEQEFLKSVLASFVELIEKEMHEDSAHDEFEELGLFKFEFSLLEVYAWTTFYKQLKIQETQFPPIQQRITNFPPIQQVIKIFPSLPEVCDFKYSNDPLKATNTNTMFVAKNRQVREMFEKFKEKYNDVFDPSKNNAPEKTEMWLRKWFHARAWLAFRKAVKSNLFGQEDDLKKQAYIKKNHVDKDSERYFVLGLPMSLEGVSRQSYFVSL